MNDFESEEEVFLPLPSGKDRAVLCAQISSDLRGRDILVLDVRKIASWTDYLVIATGSSGRQVSAVADEIALRLKRLGDRRLGREGTDSGGWVVLDFGDVVVHLFDDEKRSYYQLERLWEDAEQVRWEPELASPTADEPSPSLSTH